MENIKNKKMGKKRGYIDHFGNAMRSFENEIIRFETNKEMNEEEPNSHIWNDEKYSKKITKVKNKKRKNLYDGR